MKITIYELLGLVKDGKAPKIIKYKDTLYEYDSNDEFYFNNGWSLYREFPENGNCLNDEVEIEEEEKKIPENNFNYIYSCEDEHIMANFENIKTTLKDIIDYLESKERGE